MAYLIVAIIFGVIGAAVGSGKGRGGLGFILGALLSLIGVIIIAVMDPSPDYMASSGSHSLSGPSVSTTGAIKGSLARLEQLRQSGSLTADEYAAERARVLASV